MTVQQVVAARRLSTDATKGTNFQNKEIIDHYV